MEMMRMMEMLGAGDSDGDDGPEAEDDRRKDIGEKPDIERTELVHEYIFQTLLGTCVEQVMCCR